MDRSNHYEAAFAAFLRRHRVCHIAIDETRRSLFGAATVKSLDFVVQSADGRRWVVDVKGRRFPGGTPERPRRVWESWATQEDVEASLQWARRFGPGYRALLVFAYDLASPHYVPQGEHAWECQGRVYVYRAVPV